MRPWSLRSQILAAIVSPPLILGVAFGAILYGRVAADRRDDLDRGLRARAAAIAGHIERVDAGWEVDFEGESGPPPDVIVDTVAWQIDTWPEGAALTRDPGGAELPVLIEPSAVVLPDQPLPGRPREVIGVFQSLTGSLPLRVYSGVYLARLDLSPGHPAIVPEPMIRVTMAQDLGPLQRDLRSLLAALVGLGGALGALTVGAGWFLTRRILGPLEAMTTEAEQIQAGSAGPSLARSGRGDEVDRLGVTLNRAFGRLYEAFVRQERFTADASHELRTPLALIRAEAEVALQKPRSPEAYREALAGVVVGAERMRQIVDALLLLARMDAGHRHVDVEPQDLLSLAQASVGTFADPRLRVEGPSGLVVRGDARLLGVLIDNLVSNALRHSPVDGAVTVEVGPGPILEVVDQGEGIPEAAIPHLFERFFRVDADRGRSAGGTGLGLAIVAAVAKAHGAEVSVDSRVGHGARFTVVFPAAGP